MKKLFDTLCLVVGVVTLAVFFIGFTVYGIAVFPKVAVFITVGAVVVIGLSYVVKLATQSAQLRQTPPKLLQAKTPILQEMQNKIWNSLQAK